jgi:ABC-type branched-subunit amino acid transport system ATPase component
MEDSRLTPSATDEGRLPADGPALRVTGLTVAYGKAPPVIENVDIEVAPGEIVGLIGPNGAGKTSLVNAVSGVVRPRAGKVSVGGVDVSRRSMARRVKAGLSRTFQLPQANDELTVEEQLAVMLPGFAWAWPLLGQRRYGPRLAEVLEQLSLTESRRRKIPELTLGEYRRFELARALATDPTVVLADETVSGLDEGGAETLHRALRWLADRHVGVLLIEHNIPFVRKVADRLVVLDLGRVIAAGDPAEVLALDRVRTAYLGTADAAA